MSASARILYLIDHFQTAGGTERHLHYLLTNLDRRLFTPCLVVFDLVENELVEDIRSAGVEVLHIPVHRYYTPRALKQLRALFLHMRAARYDIVQTYHYKADVVGALVARLAGARFIVSSKRDTGDWKSSRKRIISRAAIPLLDASVIVARDVGQCLHRQEGLDLARAQVIYNGVDLVKYRPPTAAERGRARRQLGWREEDFVLAMVAWFRPEKDHTSLLQAIAACREAGQVVKTILVGAGPELPRAKEMVRELGIAEDVNFAGPLSDVREVLAAADVGCIVPSHNEGFSNAVLEKMATGLPMIVTDVGGNAEAVAHDVNGRVIAARDVQALVAALIELRTDSERRAAMGAASRERAERHFSLDKMIANYQDYYSGLLKRSR